MERHWNKDSILRVLDHEIEESARTHPMRKAEIVNEIAVVAFSFVEQLNTEHNCASRYDVLARAMLR